MMKLIKTNTRELLELDTNTLKVSTVDALATDIDYVYTPNVGAEMDIDDETVTIKEGDVLFKFYGFPEHRNREYLLINCPELREFLNKRDADTKKEKAKESTLLSVDAYQ